MNERAMRLANEGIALSTSESKQQSLDSLDSLSVDSPTSEAGFDQVNLEGTERESLVAGLHSNVAEEGLSPEVIQKRKSGTLSGETLEELDRGVKRQANPGLNAASKEIESEQTKRSDRGRVTLKTIHVAAPSGPPTILDRLMNFAERLLKYAVEFLLNALPKRGIFGVTRTRTVRPTKRTAEEEEYLAGIAAQRTQKKRKNRRGRLGVESDEELLEGERIRFE